MKFRLISLLTLLAIPQFLLAELRDFTDTSGRTIRAEITGTDGQTTIDLKLENGSEFPNLSIEMFSAEDQVFIRNWIEVYLEEMKAQGVVPLTDANMRVSFNPNRIEEIESSKRYLVFKPEVTVKLKSDGSGYNGVRCQLCIIGMRKFEDVKYYRVLEHSEFVLNIQPNKPAAWKGEPFVSELSEAGEGFEYSGYLLIMQDNTGMDFVRSSRNIWQTHYKNILTARPEVTYEETFQEKIVGYF